MNDSTIPPIAQGTSIVVVRDTLLAAAMIACGILPRKDPAYVHVRMKNGDEQWSFNFLEQDSEGHVTAKDCIEAWQQPYNWIKSHPAHPFSFAMMALKNFAQIREHQATSRPFHCYALPDTDNRQNATLMVMADSNNERLAISKGYTRL